MRTERPFLVCSVCLLCAAFIGVACSGPTGPEAGSTWAYPAPKVKSTGTVIAQIGPVALTTDEIEQRIRAKNPIVQAQIVADRKSKQTFVTNELRFELLAQEAWHDGMLEDPKIIRLIKEVLVDEIVQREMSQMSGSIEVKDADLVKAYKRRYDEFNRPATIRLSQIVRYVKGDGERTAAKELLTRLEREVVAAQKKSDYRAFERLAAEHSQDEATKSRGGDLKFLDQEQLAETYGEEVAKYLFEEVEVGDLAVADAPNAVVLFKKSGRRRGVTQSLEMVRGRLQSEVAALKKQEAFEKVVDEIMKERGVVVNEDAIDEVEVDLSKTQMQPRVSPDPDPRAEPTPVE